MLGIENMISSMIGMDMDELKARVTQAAQEGQQIVSTIMQQNNEILNRQAYLVHKFARMEKMMESIMRERGIEIPSDENEVMVNGSGKQLPN